MKTTTEDMRNHVAQMPMGSLIAYQLYIFIAAHSDRHTQQMNEVKTSAGFPAQIVFQRLKKPRPLFP